MKMKLAVLTTHPIQYQVPVWRALAQDPDIDLHVFFGSDFSVRGYRDAGFGIQVKWDVPLTAGYSSTFLSTDEAIERSGDLNLAISTFKQHLLAFRPNFVLLNGYSPYAFYLKAFLALRYLSIPIIFRAEATDEAVVRDFVKHHLRDILLHFFYSQIRTVLAVGYNARHHYLSKGVPPVRIGWSPYCVDTDFVEAQYQQWLPQREEIRRPFGFDGDQPVFLFSGKLIPKKDPLLIATALRIFISKHGKAGLVVMGDGPLRGQLEAEIASIPGLLAVFTGFQNQSQVGKFYAAADCLVLPSCREETWGLVVNEALQFGLPAIVSDQVGCRHDLIEEGKTGFVFPARQAEALADAMEKTVQNLKIKKVSIQEACREKIARYSIEQAVNGIRDALVSK